MILTGNEDLRIRKTIKSIQDSFLELIINNNYEKITVKTLCAKAMVNKKTFYNYYETLDDLLIEIQEIMLKEYMKRISHLKVPDDLFEVNKEFFLYSESKGKAYEKIMCAKAYNDISKTIARKFVNSTWNDSPFLQNMNVYNKNILFCYLSLTGLELYRQWVLDGKKIPIDEIIEISGKLLCSGVNGFKSIGN